MHQDDVAGHLLAAGGWAHLDLPAIALERQAVPIGHGEVHERCAGEVLHPAHELRLALEQIKAEIGTFNFNAQYLQRPVVEEGNLIRWSWFRRYRSPPAHDADGRIIQSWDTALKAGLENDYSVCTTWLMKGTDYYLLDVVRERLDYPALKRRVVEVSHRLAAHSVLIEDKGSGISLIQDLRWQKTGVRPIAIQPKADKITRMATHAALIEAGQVHLPEKADWLDDFQAEFLAFPQGRYDDQVEAQHDGVPIPASAMRGRVRQTGTGRRVENFQCPQSGRFQRTMTPVTLR